MEVLELAGIGEIKVRRSANIKYFAYSDGSGAWGFGWVFLSAWAQETGGEISGRESGSGFLKNRKDMKVYEEDTGVGLGIGAEIKTKLHVLRIVETEEPKPSYRLEQEKITLFIPKKSISVK